MGWGLSRSKALTWSATVVNRHTGEGKMQLEFRQKFIAVSHRNNGQNEERRCPNKNRNLPS
jgi:hypothetical protein